MILPKKYTNVKVDKRNIFKSLNRRDCWTIHILIVMLTLQLLPYSVTLTCGCGRPVGRYEKYKHDLALERLE